ncbi:hypothetical protein FT663_00690 [Candidozyma haemuli var. vulneris]|uniref:ATP-dependent (S)-NAD(P)H-hydrate dehydratase n=1 Tax=Candidozyma haemuli TaxID=45357 RepID=A0A2V1AQ61_9ASCO|nr:YjeF family domain-containing protein [[Candida] haemuloni]KAF3992410.1 hypothetical protein FT662_01119 [[Candida] haemuloni var. vulneris]KAF3995147.1 hypothetical protein FT663_00690 [[Candida] haemuloni var. vulneris]PVH19854.1 YjeF family domain-containing protein [[Candida] haemuloni]
MFKGKSQKELIQVAKTLIQPLKPGYHKGQAGKIAVFGGCEDYTGAPFFSAHSAALVGADLSHIVCEKQAAPVIKSYSPDLMVHPYLFDLENADVRNWISVELIEKLKKKPLDEILNARDELDKIVEDHVLPKISGLMERVDMFVVGPGFGRDALMLKTLIRVIEEIKVVNKPVILDADSLYLVSVRPNVIKGYPKAVLTPNVVEFGRICRALTIDNTDDVETAKRVSKALGGVTIIKKGRQEVIVRNDSHVVNEFSGSLRRVGGQGDSLTGALATLLTWTEHYNSGFWEGSGKIDEDESILLACFAACSIVRVASSKAFYKYKRAMQTSNVHEFLGEAYEELLGDE